MKLRKQTHSRESFGRKNCIKNATAGGAKSVRSRTQIAFATVLISLVAAGLGCASAPAAKLVSSEVSEDLNTWIAQKSKAPAPSSAFVKAEREFWNLDYVKAFKDYVDVLKDPSATPVHNIVVERLAGVIPVLRDDYDADIQNLFNQLNWDALDPKARLELVEIANGVAAAKHEKEQVAAPFLESHYGHIINWNVTPTVSTDLSKDFDKVLELEKVPLPKEMPSPLDAADSPIAIKRVDTQFQTTRPHKPSSLQNGISYYESFLNVAGDAPTDFYVVIDAIGKIRLTIDGHTVFDVSNYTSVPKEYVAKVRLTPGLHRVLLKEAETGGSSNADPRFIPATGNPVKQLTMPLLTSYNNCFGTPKPGWCLEVTPQTTFAKSEVLKEGHPLSDWNHYEFEYKDLSKLGTNPSDDEVGTADAANLKAIKDLTDAELYIVLLQALSTNDHALFQDSWKVFKERHPDFAPGQYIYYLGSQNLPYYPYDFQKTESLNALRKALKLEPDNAKLLSTLYLNVRGRTVDKDEATLKHLVKVLEGTGSPYAKGAAYAELGRYYEGQNWSEEAESAFRKALEASPNNCLAAKNLQYLLYQRNLFVKPGELVEDPKRCPELTRSYYENLDNEKSVKFRLERAKTEAAQAPFSIRRTLNLATQLRESGRLADAYQVILDAIKMTPNHSSLYEAKAELELHGAKNANATNESEKPLPMSPEQNLQYAITTYKEAIKNVGDEPGLLRRLAELEGAIPLRDFIPDGKTIAMEEVKNHPLGEAKATKKSSLAGDDEAGGDDDAAPKEDEVYYVYDMAVEKLLPSGGNASLTYALIRVMTKDAINRYAEQSIPGNALPIFVRTIKQDGTVQTPDENLNKSNYSMTGLAEGDFIEIAYLSFTGPKPNPNVFQSNPFYFEMPSIGTRHSEYNVLGLDALKKSDGSKGYKILRMNGAPEPVEKELHGEKALVFVQKDNPSPRPEPATDQAYSFLPWVQIYTDDDLDKQINERRTSLKEGILQNTGVTPDLVRLFKKWAKAADKAAKQKRGSRAWIERIYLQATKYLTDVSGGGDAGQMFYSKSGDPTILFMAALRYYGVPFDVYGVKSSYHPDIKIPPNEVDYYMSQLLRIKATDGDVWTEVGDRRSSFNSATGDVIERPAICFTCDSNEITQTPSASEFRTNRADYLLEGTLTPNGTLVGTISLTTDGAAAQRFRTIAASTTNDRLRERVADSAINQMIPGSRVVKTRYINEYDRTLPFTFEISFETPNFAQQTPTGLMIDKSFLSANGSSLVKLPQRTTPMLTPLLADETGTVVINLPPNTAATLESAPEITASFNNDRFSRITSIENNTLTIKLDIETSMQHIPTAEYGKFRTFVLALKDSSLLKVRLSTTPKSSK